MKLENYEMHLPSYSIGDKIYEKIGPVLESYGKTVPVILVPYIVHMVVTRMDTRNERITEEKS